MKQTKENISTQQSAGFPFFFRQICRVLRHIQYGSVTFILPDGRQIVFTGEQEKDAAAIIMVRKYSFARRAVLGGDIGFFEGYANGEWDTPDLAACLYIFARNADYFQNLFSANPALDWLNTIRHAFNKNTRRGSRRNIMAHYDLGNSFYEKWLDPSMTYSSAVYPSAEAELEEAQLNKYATLADAIALKPDETILEIGSGWGGFAEFAAKYHSVKVTGLTLSPSQLEYAQKRIFKAGLADKVEFKLLDYRDVDQTFDKVASIEMFEAVGKEYWATYFEKVRSVLKPGGIAGLQIITIADRFFDRYSKSTDFIQRYVFPGGILPSPSILQSLVGKAGLTLRGVSEFGQDYAHTLNEWHRQFNKAWDEIRPLGFDARFKKLWEFYLAYCEAGFRAGTTNVCQLTASRA